MAAHFGTIAWFGLAAWLGMVGTAGAQPVQRPESVWGVVPVQPEGLVLGSVELLAGLLIGLFLSWLASVWLLLEKWRLLLWAGGGGTTDSKSLWAKTSRRRALLAWLTYAVAPTLGIAATVLARHRTLFGVDVALLATLLALSVIVTGMVAFVISGAVRERLEGT
ncbi:MAG: hypothetical protein MI919_02150 [Holophagales bacterium]|nr:hypothetical protein [Holophagales bacterium]